MINLSACMKQGMCFKANDTTFSRTAHSIIKPGSPTGGLARLQCVLNSVLSGHYSMHTKITRRAPRDDFRGNEGQAWLFLTLNRSIVNRLWEAVFSKAS